MAASLLRKVFGNGNRTEEGFFFFYFAAVKLILYEFAKPHGDAFQKELYRETRER